MSENQEIIVWAVCIDANYELKGQPFELCISKTSSISRMISQVARDTKYTLEQISILKVEKPVLLPDYRADGPEDPNKSQTAIPFSAYLKELWDNPELVRPLPTTRKVSRHFKDAEDVLQAIVLIDSKLSLLSVMP